MITEIEVQNYKSIESLCLSIGRINVLIGENGSGKSNILEAIAFGAAASNGKLDNEFLYTRGIRVPQNPAFMRAAFEPDRLSQDISLYFKAVTGTSFKFLLEHDNRPYSSWGESEQSNIDGVSTAELIAKFLQLLHGSAVPKDKKIREELLRRAMKDNSLCSYLSEFLIFAPENSLLRTYDREGQIQPLGIRGEGLFRYLSYLSLDENIDRLEDIKRRMQLLEWFRDFAVAEDASDHDGRIDIEDKYISKSVGPFNQLSANEGFLMILFYFCLVVGAETPRFFAIDNIDTALNPRLCTRVMKEIVDLAKKYDKQIILTTHNPAILDGLNLDDDEQRLFVVRRNKLGQTTLKRVMKPKVEDGEEPVRLSEAFLRGYLGGLPRNF